MDTPTAEELRELQDRCDAGDEEACRELDRRGIEPPVIEPDQVGTEDGQEATACNLIMTGSLVEELRRLHERYKTTKPPGWLALGRGIEARELTERASDYRVPLEQLALDFIEAQLPHLCRLWPAVFGTVPMVPPVGETLSQVAERARGKTVVDVRPAPPVDGDWSGVEVVLVNGTRLRFRTPPTIVEPPERPSERAMRLSEAGRS